MLMNHIKRMKHNNDCNVNKQIRFISTGYVLTWNSLYKKSCYFLSHNDKEAYYSHRGCGWEMEASLTALLFLSYLKEHCTPIFIQNTLTLLQV